MHLDDITSALFCGSWLSDRVKKKKKDLLMIFEVFEMTLITIYYMD